jgi:DNA invertase Pin-like site-specific DNA recombinase
VGKAIEYSTATGRMISGIFAALVEYERVLINERAADARAAAKVRGKQTGGTRALSADQARQIRALHASRESAGDLAKTFGVGRPTVYRVLAESPTTAWTERYAGRELRRSTLCLACDVHTYVVVALHNRYR